MEAVQSQFIMTMLSSLTFTWRVCTPKPVLNKCLLCAKQSSTHLMILTHRCMLSHFSHAQLFATPRTVACQAFLSIGLSRQEYWSRLLCPPPGDLPDPGIRPASLMSPAWAGLFFTTCATREAEMLCGDGQSCFQMLPNVLGGRRCVDRIAPVN